ncbi:MAG: hypothetical protein ABW252_03740 [Polyangiales bacterium]
MTIRIHIDRLVLEGIALDRPSTARLEEALVAHLRALFAEAPADWSELVRLDAARTPGAALGPLRLAARVDGPTLGRDIAQALHAGVRGDAREGAGTGNANGGAQ